jgi:hypothetical protein
MAGDPLPPASRGNINPPCLQNMAVVYYGVTATGDRLFQPHGREPCLLQSYQRSPFHRHPSTGAIAISICGTDLGFGGDIVRCTRLWPRLRTAQRRTSTTPCLSGYSDMSSLGPFSVWNWSLQPTCLALASQTSLSFPFYLNVDVLNSLDGRRTFTNYVGLIAQADCSSWDLQRHLPLDLGWRCHHCGAQQMSPSPMWNSSASMFTFCIFYLHFIALGVLKPLGQAS